MRLNQVRCNPSLVVLHGPHTHQFDLSGDRLDDPHQFCFQVTALLVRHCSGVDLVEKTTLSIWIDDYSRWMRDLSGRFISEVKVMRGHEDEQQDERDQYVVMNEIVRAHV